MTTAGKDRQDSGLGPGGRDQQEHHRGGQHTQEQSWVSRASRAGGWGGGLHPRPIGTPHQAEPEE